MSPLRPEQVRINYVHGWQWEPPYYMEPTGETEEPRGGFTVGWGVDGVGFGEVLFKWDGEKLTCDSEAMSRESVAAILAALARDCKLECES